MKVFKIALLVLGLALPLISGCGSQSQSGTILFSDDFNTLSSSKWTLELPNKYPATIIVDPKNSANKVVCFQLGKDAEVVAGSIRAEIAQPAEAPLQERWYAFKIYLPNYATDTKSAEVLAQWHGTSDQGEPWTVPSLRLMTSNGKWTIGRHYYDPVNNANVSIEEYLGIPYAVNTWTSWVFHIRWGWLPSHRPLLEIYKDGKLVYTRPGASNTTNDQVGVFFKIGIYKSDWAENSNSVLESRTVYHDAVQIGDRNCKLSDF